MLKECVSEDSAASIKTLRQILLHSLPSQPTASDASLLLLLLYLLPLLTEIFVITAVKSGIQSMFGQVGPEALSCLAVDFSHTQPFPASTVEP
jgi:hypothetical protein